MKTLYFKKGEDIVQENDLSDCVYIIHSGLVEVTRMTAEGEKKVIADLGENEIFGEMGLIDGLPRSATVTALEDSTVSSISKECFDSLSRHNPEALMPILKILVSRLRAVLDKNHPISQLDI